MCLKSKKCELIDIENLSKNTILPFYDWIQIELDKFNESLVEFYKGNKNYSLKILKSIDSEKLREYAQMHAQSSGRKRMFMLNKKPEKSIPIEDRDPIRGPSLLEDKVFIRDNYQCRYCNIKLYNKKEIDRIIKDLGQDYFSKKEKPSKRHGILHFIIPVADHLYPWCRGGETSLKNLITSCGPCNYGKNNFSVEELEISNPLENIYKNKFWDGGFSLKIKPE
jgi:5-methylcytosine-specific restriction endonuclease McrA